MITVTGYIDGVAYTAVIDADAKPGEDHPGWAGIVSGSNNVLDLLRMHEGETVRWTPTGPTMPLDLADSTAIVLGLRNLTKVVNTLGDGVPDAEPEAEPGTASDVVY